MSEALRLAAILEDEKMHSMAIDTAAAAELRRLHELVEHLKLTVFGFETKLATRGYEIQIDDLKGEMRRLHALNAELVEALKNANDLDADANALAVSSSALADSVDKLTALNAELVEALHHISLCSQNSMSSQRQCGDIARAALAKVEASK